MTIKKVFAAIIVSSSFINAFDNEIMISGVIVASAEANIFNVGRLDESILFSTNNKAGANITIKAIAGSRDAQLISNGKIMALPKTYAIFDKPLVIETPVQIDSKKKATLGVDISIN